MTNLQEGAPRLRAEVVRRIWFWLPIGAGAALAAALAVLVAAPLWVTLQRDTQRLREVEALSARLSEERLRARRGLEAEENVGGQRARLLRVISGNGDISTFLAQLDQLAKASGVQLDLYEPTTAAAPPPGGAPAAAAPPPAAAPVPGAAPGKPGQAADPLEAEGLRSHPLLLSARGRFPQLLSFLRDLEALNVLVAQSDLQLNLAPPPEGSNAAPVVEPVTLKLALKLYGTAPTKDSQGKGSVVAARPR